MPPSSRGGWEAATEPADRPPLSSWTSYFRVSCHRTDCTGHFVLLFVWDPMNRCLPNLSRDDETKSSFRNVFFFVQRHNGQIPETKQFYVEPLSSSPVL